MTWANLIKWVYYALLQAEESGLTKANVATFAASTNPEIRRLLGLEGDFGKPIGLEKDWAAKAIAAVGNYAEMYETNLG